MTTDTFLEIDGVHCSVTIEPRPDYCDRGNFIAKLHVTDGLVLYIDAADAWPRYYFDVDRAKSEVVAWLVKRGEFFGHSTWEVRR